ncbi:rhodanese-like domain-containing protein [Trichocoleus desertorum AS-A10]|uniref:rhodanese-like domain-containing protein n=1 Tax=Trichocoleus desertorum TaxID=1481672 RepID=UPI003297702B
MNTAPTQSPNHRQLSNISFLLKIGLWTSAIAVSLLAYIIYHPDALKPLIQAGLPLGSLSHLPLIGDSIRAAEAPQVSVQALKQLIDSKAKNFVLIDVRTPEEYGDVHLPGAVSIPIAEIEQGSGIAKIKALAIGHQVITYCTAGQRSNKALELLRKAEIQGSSVKGGIRAWRKQIDPSMSEI